MKIDFDQEEYKKQKEIQERLAELKKIEESQMSYATGKIKKYEEIIEDYKKEIVEQETKLKKLSSFFLKRKNADEINQLNAEINYRKKRIEELQKEIDEQKATIEKITKEKEELESIKKENQNLDALIYDEKGAIITDKEGIKYSPTREDQVMVHCTNFFPKDKKVLCNYDGNKQKEDDFEIKGITKKVKYLSHRHTTHFTINSAVLSTSDGRGYWHQPKFIIIEPLEEHKSQFISNLTVRADEFTYGSIELGEKPILLVREDAYGEIPEEELDNYNIIRYSGEYSKCVDNMLQILGYELTYGDKNNGNHNGNKAYATELKLNRRNMIINYLLDNKYDGKEDIEFSIEEVYGLFDVFEEKNDKNEGKYMSIFHPEEYDEISEIIKVPASFIKFCIGFGLYKDNDVYKIYNDEIMYEKIKEYFQKEENKEPIIPESDYIRIIQIYIDYLKCKKSKIINQESNNEINALAKETKELDILQIDYDKENLNKMLEELKNSKEEVPKEIQK